MEPCPKFYDKFVTMAKRVSRKYIPRTEYIAGLGSGPKSLLGRYQKLYSDSFSEAAIQAGENVLQAISTTRTERWYPDTENNKINKDSIPQLNIGQECYKEKQIQTV